MLPDKRLRNALVASVLLNTACVAWVGGSSLTHPSRPAQPHQDPSAKLHPVPVDLHRNKQATPSPENSEREVAQRGGAEGGGAEGGTASSGNQAAAGGSNATASGASGSADGDPGKPMAQSQTANVAGKGTQPPPADDKTDPDPEHTNAPHRYGTTPAAMQNDRPADKRFMMAMARHENHASFPNVESPVKLNAEARHGTQRPAEASKQFMQKDDGNRPTGAAASRDPRAALRDAASKQSAGPDGKSGPDGGKKQNGNDKSAQGGKRGGSHTVKWGDSISPKVSKPGKMKLDLGTVHMRRPDHSITGGGYADLRNVDITAHFAVDDPKNVPKNIKPDKLVKKFKSFCVADPGNTSKCLPTGGNTKLGGYTLHGHNHITGLKYCVPGSGIPGAGGGKNGQSQAQQSRGKTEGQSGHGQNQVSSRGSIASNFKGISGKYVGRRYQGSGPARTVALGTDGRNLSGDGGMGTTLHLPGRAADNHRFVPGAEVPKENQEWVSDPKAHKDISPDGKLTTPMPRFRVAVNSIGSFSAEGTVNWERPHKPQPKKKPRGGDGTGLIGMYYKGMNFEHFVFKRPDRNIDFDWVAKGPGPRIPGGRVFSVRWLGEIVPDHTDDYTLMVASDDGERLYIDGKLVLSNWSVHAPAEDMATIHLEANHHYSFKLEYFENEYGLAVTKVYWEGPNTPRQYIPESCFRYPKDRLL